jgi:hypothetical protein
VTNLEKVKHFLTQFGINTHQFKMGIKGSLPFLKDYKIFKQQFNKQEDFKSIGFYPLLADRYDSAGVASGHYFHQDLYVARKIFEANPMRHVDVGSRIDGFVAHVASYREIEIIDIRNITSKSKNIKFMQADLMSDQFHFSEKTPSLSCLHAIEHFGLGRYGDPMDLDGHKKGIKNLVSCLSERGTLYLSTPIGRPRIEFNAHRVFDIHYLMEIFSSLHLNLKSFSYVNDLGELIEDVDLHTDEGKKNFNLEYGCGIFELIKE